MGIDSIQGGGGGGGVSAGEAGVDGSVDGAFHGFGDDAGVVLV